MSNKNTHLKQQLPPLNSLLCFEAAARHLSFTLAGKELGVTQAAVSRQIKLLESTLNITLFNRFNRRLTLTLNAKALLPKVQQSLTILVNAIEETHSTNTANKITISATVAFHNLRLNSWLTQFQHKYPDVEINVITQDKDINLLTENVDLALGCGLSPQPDTIASDFLYSDEIFPVCSPEYLRIKGKLDNCADLLSHSLLHLDEDHWRELNWDAINWSNWFDSQQLKHQKPLKGLTINNYPLLLVAVKNGQGIALGWQHLVSDLIARGELVKPLDNSFITQRSYYLLSHLTPRTKQVEALKDWILKQSRNSDEE